MIFLPFHMKLNSPIPRLFGADAVTFGSTIFFRGAHPSAYLIGHEYRHVEQYHDYGIVGFFWRYLVRWQWPAMEADASAYGAAHQADFAKYARLFQ